MLIPPHWETAGISEADSAVLIACFIARGLTNGRSVRLTFGGGCDEIKETVAPPAGNSPLKGDLLEIMSPFMRLS